MWDPEAIPFPAAMNTSTSPTTPVQPEKPGGREGACEGVISAQPSGKRARMNLSVRSTAALEMQAG